MHRLPSGQRGGGRIIALAQHCEEPDQADEHRADAGHQCRPSRFRLRGQNAGRRCCNRGEHSESRHDDAEDHQRRNARHERSSECRSEDRDGNASQHQQDEVTQIEHAAIALHGLPQEVHRPPFDDLEPSAIEQVNDDRARGRDEASNGKRAREEFQHRWVSKESAGKEGANPLAKRLKLQAS